MKKRTFVTQAAMTVPETDPGRVGRDVESLAAFGRAGPTAVTRLAFTAADEAAHRHAGALMRTDGLEVYYDAFGNLFGRRFVRLLYVPLAIILPFVLALSFVGVYSVNQSIFDFGLMLIFGVIAYYMRKREYPLAPMVLAFVLGGQMEQNFRRSLMLSNGAYGIFVHNTLSTAHLFASLAILVFPFAMARFQRRGALASSGH